MKKFIHLPIVIGLAITANATEFPICEEFNGETAVQCVEAGGKAIISTVEQDGRKTYEFFTEKGKAFVEFAEDGIYAVTAKRKLYLDSLPVKGDAKIIYENDVIGAVLDDIGWK